MDDPQLPTPHDDNDVEPQPEVRLELTRAGVQEVLSLYSQEQRGAREEPTFTLGIEDIENAIRERRRMLGYGLLGGLLVAVILLLASTPLYPVTGQVVLERHDMTRAESSSSGAAAGASFVATQAEIMQSDSVLADAVEAAPRAAHLDEDDNALAAAVEAISASPISGTQIVALGYLGPDAIHGVALIEAIVDAYRNALVENEAAVQNEKLRAKQAEIAVLDAEAADLEDRLRLLRVEKGTFGSAEDTADAQTLLLRDLAQQLTDARNERIALENRLATGGDQLAILDPATRLLQEQLWAAEAELARVRMSLTPRHPAVEAAQRDVTVLRRQLNQGSKATPEALRRDIEALKGLEAQLTEVYAKERQQMSAIETDRREESLLLAELSRITELSDARRGELLDQRLLTRLAETGEVGITARLIERPTLPESAAWPRPKLLLPLGAIAGLAVGFIVAILSLRRERERAEAASDGWVPPAHAERQPGRSSASALR